MYLLAQIWWLLLLAFLLGALVGYIVWRACGLPRLRSEGASGRRELLDRIEALERDNLRLEAEARAAAASMAKSTNGAAATQATTRSAQSVLQTPEPKPVPAVVFPRVGFLEQPEGGKADNLKLIRGIGPRLEKVLNAMGVYHFAQIAGWTGEDLAVVDSGLGDFAGRAVRDKWIEQARKLLERVRSAEDHSQSVS